MLYLKLLLKASLLRVQPNSCLQFESQMRTGLWEVNPITPLGAKVQTGRTYQASYCWLHGATGWNYHTHLSDDSRVTTGRIYHTPHWWLQGENWSHLPHTWLEITRWKLKNYRTPKWWLQGPSWSDLSHTYVDSYYAWLARANLCGYCTHKNLSHRLFARHKFHTDCHTAETRPTRWEQGFQPPELWKSESLHMDT